MDNNSDAFLEDAHRHYLAGRYSAAIQDYEEAIRLDPENANAHYALHLAYRNTNQLQLALKELEEAAHLAPDEGNIYLAMALLYDMIGNSKNAQEVEDIASRLPSDTTNRQINLGLLAYQQKDYQKSLLYFQDALRQRPSATLIHGHIGFALLRLRKDVEARNAFLQATQDETTKPVDLYGLAVAETRLHNYAAAALALERAIEKSECYYHALMLLSTTEARLGRWRSAWCYFKRAIQCSPHVRT